MKSARDFRKKAEGRIDRLIKRWMVSCGYEDEVEKCVDQEMRLFEWLEEQVGEAHKMGFKDGFAAGASAAKLEAIQQERGDWAPNPGGKEGE